MKNANELKIEELGLKSSTLSCIKDIDPVTLIAATQLQWLTAFKGIGRLREKEITDALVSAGFAIAQNEQSTHLANLICGIFGEGYHPWSFRNPSELKYSDYFVSNYSSEQIQYFIDTFLSTLASRESEIIIRTYGLCGERQNLEDVAAVMLISKERVRQIWAKAMRKLRHPVRAKPIREWLFSNISEETREQMMDRLNSLTPEVEEIEKKINELKNSPAYSQFERIRNGLKRITGDLTAPIETLNLSIRSFNCLKRYGCKTIADISKLSHDELLMVPNLGRRCADEISEVLAKL